MAALNGTAAGGGYELALACDQILLTDDGSSTVSLPEVPLLGVLPGTGGLTRLTDKRGVRRDLADVFATTAEGVRGQRAVDWRLVDEIARPTEFRTAARRLAEHAMTRAPGVPAPAGGGSGRAGIELPALVCSASDDSLRYEHVRVDLDRRAGTATITVAGPAAAPAGLAALHDAGAAAWPLAAARELDDAISRLRFGEPELGTWLLKTTGDPAAVLATDDLLAEPGDWLAAAITGLWKRTLRRLDASSRSLIALIEPGSCFAGTLLELALAADRQYMLDGVLDDGPGEPAVLALGAMNAGPLAAASGASRLAIRFGRAERELRGRARRDGQAAGRGRGRRARPGHRRPGRAGLGRRDPAGGVRAGRVLPRRAVRPRGEPALRRRRVRGDEDLRPALGLAELDLPAAQRVRSGGSTAQVRDRAAGRIRPEEGLAMSDAELDAELTGPAPAPGGPVSVIDYSERIPNNVGLATDRKLQRALESWQPRFLDWWAALGPSLPTRDVYLRTAVAIGRDGWASWARVPMEQYRWGIFLSERGGEPRQIPFGQHLGEPAWQQVPGEYRSELRRLIVVQGDTEPASVEQQRHLGATAPSLYDLRNLFQVNVEEGRHLWAMVYLLHAYFGRDGREEAEQLLRRHSGHPDSPRILGAFNEETTDWLSFFMFTYFTDRDGKYQLGTLKESGFDPLSRTCEFMLREEAHHMFVGTTGVQRVVQRTAAVTAEHGTEDIWALRRDPAARDPEVPEPAVLAVA